MGKIVISQFISLDGVVEDPGGAEDFKYGGWTFKFDRGDEGNKFKLDEVMAAEALLLGRVTYEGFAAAWPGRTDEAGFADKFNSMPKYVVSSTLHDPEWNNSTVLSGDVVEEVGRLRQQVDRDILVNGSIQLSQALLAHGLVDELRLMVFPVVLGAGRRLYGDMESSATFRLREAKQGGDALITTYEPAGANG
ncbi:MAG: dihydrofolate reductase family protein [Solirubrobacterales bacterium]|nr:dihydrofolate reductase family protein [Solirubrobacterales bacterium]